MEKSTQNSTIIKYQKKVLNLFICQWFVIWINSVFRTGKNYYPQVFLEECKYIVQEKEMSEYITDDTEVSFDYQRDDSMKKILLKKILMKKIKCKILFIFFLYKKYDKQLL